MPLCRCSTPPSSKPSPCLFVDLKNMWKCFGNNSMYNSCIIMLQTTPILFYYPMLCNVQVTVPISQIWAWCSSNLCLHVRAMACAPTHPVSSLHFCVFEFVPAFARDGARPATSFERHPNRPSCLSHPLDKAHCPYPTALSNFVPKLSSRFLAKKTGAEKATATQNPSTRRVLPDKEADMGWIFYP
jgi:hypothetical protein